jgi:tetratricopeptide (TPR) repeat protein
MPNPFWMLKGFLRYLLHHPVGRVYFFEAGLLNTGLMLNMKGVSRFLLLLACTLLTALAAVCQPKLEFSMKKPTQFQERKLGSEKSADKKFTKVRRFFQNTYSHYNYYFNANQKLQQIIDFATQAQKDDYTDLLSFFPYSLATTAKSNDIDSILQTATAGILLHDLRNDWIDNLYMAMGKAYLLRQDFDSALMTFQFVNYSYAPKEKGGFDIPIGSNSTEGSNALSISTVEKRSLPKRILSQPPSRNESFVWMIRTLTEQRNFLDAASLVSTIKNDPVFPERLKPALGENIAYLYYRLSMWDSAAAYRERTIEMASGIEAKARMWYLTGQLYALAGNNEKAVAAFANCSKTAVDPVMDIYARLNTIRLRKGDDPRIIDENIAALMDLARRDRYRLYRDIIYYAAGLFEMERNGFARADDYLQKSLQVNENNPAQRSSSFMLLGDARFADKRYGKAALPYDSANPALLKSPDSTRVIARRPGTKAVSESDEIIFVQDSLLRLAALPDDERMAYVKEINKKLRKERGLKEEAASSSRANANGPNANATDDLFVSGQGTWYFYDPARRANGFNTFRQRWGDRRNSDNWRRSSAQPLGTNAPQTRRAAKATEATPETAEELDAERYDTADISFDNLYSRIPLSADRQLKVNNRINYAMFAKANALHEKIEDYPEAIKVYEALLARLDTGKMVPKSLFALIHCYTKTGNLEAAAQAKQRLQKQFPNHELTDQALNSKANAAKEETANREATRQYQQVYDLYLEGSFAKAAALKKATDSVYGNSYWTPQLMYIETVYYLQEKMDSLAMGNLNAILQKFPGHAIEPRVKLIKEILPKRKEIEDYLTKLQVTRAKDDSLDVPARTPVAPAPPIVAAPDENDENLPGSQRQRLKKSNLELSNKPAPKSGNSLTATLPKMPVADTSGTADLLAALADALNENKADTSTGNLKNRVTGTGAKTTVKPAGPTQPVLVPKNQPMPKADTSGTAAMLAKIAEANESKVITAPTADTTSKPTRMLEKDSLEKATTQVIPTPVEKKASNEVVAPPKPIDAATISQSKPAAAATELVATPVPNPSGKPLPYAIETNGNHLVALVLENIDPAYVNEVLYSLSNHPKRNTLQANVLVEKKKLKDKLWLVTVRSPDFTNASKAYQYIENLKPLAANEIISWLDTRKYRYLIITESNLAKLQQTNNIAEYEQLLRQTFPGKF